MAIFVCRCTPMDRVDYLDQFARLVMCKLNWNLEWFSRIDVSPGMISYFLIWTSNQQSHIGYTVFQESIVSNSATGCRARARPQGKIPPS